MPTASVHRQRASRVTRPHPAVKGAGASHPWEPSPSAIVPRPGDWVRLTNSNFGRRGAHFVVVKGHYTNGEPRFALPHVAWLTMNDCQFVRRASDVDFVKACRQAEEAR